MDMTLVDYAKQACPNTIIGIDPDLHEYRIVQMDRPGVCLYFVYNTVWGCVEAAEVWLGARRWMHSRPDRKIIMDAIDWLFKKG